MESEVFFSTYNQNNRHFDSKPSNGWIPNRAQRRMQCCNYFFYPKSLTISPQIFPSIIPQNKSLHEFLVSTLRVTCPTNIALSDFNITQKTGE